MTLRGFKSFKSKSTLTFEPGISVVVGPNGSGKSNIADAISWVLGEQSPKSLRGASMGDIIFRNRQEEMGIAEVSLMFDNRDKSIDLDFSDVRITRRVYAQGGSDYFINGSPTRLMDIQDMLADSGIGKGLYTIINQGQINEIAMLKPDERKAIIEEIGGISKHKIRRKKSLSKLERVSQDMDRIDDLLEEIKRTMVPLEVEAEKAKKYSAVLSQLKNEEISYYMSQMNQLNLAWNKKDAQEKKINHELKQANKDLDAAQKKLDDYKNDIAEKLAQYRCWEQTVHKMDQAIDRLNNLNQLISSKVSVFSTLSHMFEAKQEQPKTEKEGSMYQKLKNLQMLVHDYINHINNTMAEKQARIESQGRYICRKLDELLSLFEKEKQNKQIKVHRQKQNLIFKDNCIQNLEKAKNLMEINQNFSEKADCIKKRVYPQFLDRKKDIQQEQSRIAVLEEKIHARKLESSNLENARYKNKLDKDQIKEKTQNITTYIVDHYNISIDYMLKNYKPAADIQKTRTKISSLKKQVKNFGAINPNASLEYERIRKRHDFLYNQRKDLHQSKKNLETLIADMDKQIMEAFIKKFDQINQSFGYYFKILFPMGEGELLLSETGHDYDHGVDLKVDIGNNKFVPLSLLSGGEKTLVSIAFLFSIFATNLSPFYVFDEADAALDDINIDRFLSLVKKFAEKQQIILITHQKKTMEIADTIYGVSMQSDGVSKIVSEKISGHYAKTH